VIPSVAFAVAVSEKFEGARLVDLELEPLRSIAVKVANQNQRGCDDETNDLAWRGCPIIPVRACQPGVGAARNH